MPRGDGRGPTGAGPGTGRTKCLCMGFGIPGTFSRFQDTAPPGGGGGRQGRCNRFSNTGPTGSQRSAGFGFGPGPRGLSTSGSGFMSGPRLETLRSLVIYLEEALAGIKRRIQKMEPGMEGNQRIEFKGPYRNL